MSLAFRLQPPHDQEALCDGALVESLRFSIEESMISYFWLIGGMLVVYWFIQQRKQDERATALARQLCEQQQVQFLECARVGHKLQSLNGKKRLRTLYLVDFSGDGESRYQAELWLKGLRLAAFELPPFRM